MLVREGGRGTTNESGFSPPVRWGASVQAIHPYMYSCCRVNECTQFVMGFRPHCQLGAAGNGIYGVGRARNALGIEFEQFYSRMQNQVFTDFIASGIPA